jgi:hypothetical protein
MSGKVRATQAICHSDLPDCIVGLHMTGNNCDCGDGTSSWEQDSLEVSKLIKTARLGEAFSALLEMRKKYTRGCSSILWIADQLALIGQIGTSAEILLLLVSEFPDNVAVCLSQFEVQARLTRGVGYLLDKQQRGFQIFLKRNALNPGEMVRASRIFRLFGNQKDCLKTANTAARLCESDLNVVLNAAELTTEFGDVRSATKYLATLRVMEDPGDMNLFRLRRVAMRCEYKPAILEFANRKFNQSPTDLDSIADYALILLSYPLIPDAQITR